MEEFKEVLKSNIPLGEKNKKINEFINNVPSADVDKVLSALKEDPTLDLTAIHLKLAKAFKREAMVIEILKNGNPFSVNQAVKFPWMYQPGSLFENPSYLVEELFPKCSYSCRLKIINSIGIFMKNQGNVDMIYRAIERRYGFYTALPLLKGCSTAQVTTVLSSRNVKLGDDQLLKIAKRHPEIAVRYLRQRYETKSPYKSTNYPVIVKYIVDVLPEEYIKLMEDFPEFVRCPRSFSLGIRRSRKILRINSQTIIDNITEYQPVINIRQFQRLVPWDQYKAAVLTLVIQGKEIFADKWDSDFTCRWMDNLSEVKKLELLRSAFALVFGKPLEECPKYLNSDIIQLLPHDQKQTAIQWKIENDDSDSNCFFRLGKDKVWIHGERTSGCWVIFKPTQYSIPELTQLLYVEQNVDSRAVLYKCLIFTCVVNEDLKGMTKVLQLLNKRCRNDQPTVRMYIMGALATSSRHIQLEKEHWDEIMELIQLCKLYKEISCMRSDVLTLAHRSIAYHINHKLPFEAWVELSYAYWDLRSINGIQDPLDQKKLIEGYIHKLSTMGDPVSQEGGQFSVTILRRAIVTITHASNWNSKNDTATLGRIPILSHPWLASAIQEIFKADDHRYHEQNQILLFKLLKREEDFDIDSLMSATSGSWAEPFLSFFFRQDPERLSGDAEHILHVISETHGKSTKHLKFLRTLKSLNYLSLTSKLVERSAIVVSQEDVDEASKTCTALQILITLSSSPTDFLEHAEKFYPVDTKVNATKGQIELDYQISNCLAKCFKKLKLTPGSSSQSSEVFSAIERFCVGDYLKLVSASLYSCCCHVSQEETMLFLRKQLFDQPVSVKKNMIRLFFMVSPVDGKSEILREMWNRERNPSIRAEIFKQTCRNYNNHRSPATWNVLKSAIGFLSSEDVPCLKFLRKSTLLDDSPIEVLSDFFQSSLEAVVRTDTNEGAISPIVTRIANLIYKVSDSLLDRLAKGEIRSPTTPKISTEAQFDANFCVEYLLAAVYLAALGNAKVLPHRLGLMRTILKDAIENHWNSSKLTVQTFIEKFCEKQQLLENSIGGMVGRKREVLEGLLEEVEGNPHKIFKEKLFLDLALLQLDEVIVTETDTRPPSERLSSFGKKVGLLLESYVAEYGGEMIGPIIVNLSYFLHNIFMTDFDDDDDEDNIVHLIEGLLTHSTSRHHLIVAIRFLPSKAPRRTNILASTSYEKIVQIVTDSQDLAVQLWWNTQ